jgi:hypothetical protein
LSPEEAEREVRLLKSTKALVVNLAFLPVSLALAFLVCLMFRSMDLGAHTKGEVIPLIILSVNYPPLL